MERTERGEVFFSPFNYLLAHLTSPLHCNRAMLVTWLAADGVHDLEGELIDAFVVHGQEDGAGLHGGHDAGFGMDLAAT